MSDSNKTKPSNEKPSATDILKAAEHDERNSYASQERVTLHSKGLGEVILGPTLPIHYPDDKPSHTDQKK